MNVTIKGTIEQIGDVQSVGASGFKKRETLIKETEGQFPQTFKVELLKDNTELLSAFRVGDTVSLECNLRGSEYNGRHYLNLNAWRVND